MKDIDVADIQAAVARKFSVTPKQMLSRSRNQKYIVPCQIAMYIARMHTTKSLPEIAASFDRTHASVLYGIAAIKKHLAENPSLASTLSCILEELEAKKEKTKRKIEMNFNETKHRFGDVATKLQAALALNDVFVQVISSGQNGRFTQVTVKMSSSNIKWLRENKATVLKEIGGEPIRLVESDNGIAFVEVGLPFERWKDVSYHDVMFDVFCGKTQAEDMALPVIFGVMPNGEIITRDLARMPHLLIGGLTGTGKSVFLHSLVCSLVQNRSPEQVRFVLMDPKRVEFMGYANLPHLYSPIVHEPEQGITMLKYVEAEMDRRLALFGEKGCRNIADFKKTDEGASLPYLIVVVDELSDFMLGAVGVFESTASRIAAIGRSAGVHLVIATSRPDAKVASCSLKANIPGRIAFRVCQQIDSMTLLDEYGAEELLGGGDALLKDHKGAIVRLQVPYIRDEAITRIVDSAIVRYPERHVVAGLALAVAEKEDYESMYGRALGVVRTTRRASTSWLQRQLSIGYNDAAHVMSLLEERGIIGPANDKGPREILIKDA